MLELLVTSETRRKLLVLLASGREGSVAEFARLTGMNYSITHRELRELTAAGLVQKRVKGNQRLHSMRMEHPWAEVVKQMVALSKAPARRPEPSEADDAVRAQLAAAGAPLLADRLTDAAAPLADTLAAGAMLAHRDATVARALPVCLWRNRDKIDPEELQEAARRVGARHSLGFFLDLTSKLAPAGGQHLHELAERLRDKRVTTEGDFFDGPHSKYGRELAARRTPDVARRWHYRMNMDLEVFASTFRKFTHREVLPRE